MTQRIAVFDYKIVPTNPIGSCHRRMLQSLHADHDFTVFSVQFDNPCPERIRWVRVPAPTRPLALLFVAFHLLAPFYYLGHRLARRGQFDLVQMVESNLGFGDVTYAHFCHRAYLAHQWAKARPTGVRGFFRWLDHRLHAAVEPLVYRRARAIVVPSQGLARELCQEYPFAADKIRVISNPVDFERMRQPEEFDRASFRHELGLAPDDLALIFVALGHFERKGLPLLLAALTRQPESPLKLVVVGGGPGLIETFRDRVAKLGLERRVHFVGMQPDVRPYLWAADAFAFPSHYEVFPLVALEAAGAAKPLLAAPVYGVEELLLDGVNGIALEQTVDGVERGLARFSAMTPSARRAMGAAARRDVERYATTNFVASWRTFYAEEAVDRVA